MFNKRLSLVLVLVVMAMAFAMVAYGQDWRQVVRLNVTNNVTLEEGQDYEGEEYDYSEDPDLFLKEDVDADVEVDVEPLNLVRVKRATTKKTPTKKPTRKPNYSYMYYY